MFETPNLYEEMQCFETFTFSWFCQLSVKNNSKFFFNYAQPTDFHSKRRLLSEYLRSLWTHKLYILLLLRLYKHIMKLVFSEQKHRSLQLYMTFLLSILMLSFIESEIFYCFVCIFLDFQSIIRISTNHYILISFIHMHVGQFLQERLINNVSTKNKRTKSIYFHTFI